MIQRSLALRLLIVCWVWLVLFGGCAPTRETPNSQTPIGLPRTLAQATQASTPIPTPTPRPSPERPVPPAPGAKAFDFELHDLDGQPVALSDFRGKHVMLNFWATWCGPCRIEIPYMVTLYEELRDQDWVIVAVNVREDADRVASFVEHFKMSFPVLLDRTGRVADAYFVRGIPTSIFIDKEGIIQGVHLGTLTERMLRDYVDALMHVEQDADPS